MFSFIKGADHNFIPFWATLQNWYKSIKYMIPIYLSKI